VTDVKEEVRGQWPEHTIRGSEKKVLRHSEAVYAKPRTRFEPQNE
jgi:hypothetical protein